MSESTKKWYVLRAAGGKEKKAKEYLEKEIERRGLQDLVSQVLVPTEKVYRIRDGKRICTERLFYPGYVLIEAELTGELQHIIRNEIPHMSGFLTEKRDVKRGEGKKGDMSLIGPRPLLMHYLPWYTPEQARRHEVRPGITGWAQVNGRNHCKLSKKFELDVWYVDHCTLATDLKICKMTILNIIKREDVGEGTGNMEEVDDLGFHQRYLELLEQRKKND